MCIPDRKGQHGLWLVWSSSLPGDPEPLHEKLYLKLPCSKETQVHLPFKKKKRSVVIDLGVISGCSTFSFEFPSWDYLFSVSGTTC